MATVVVTHSKISTKTTGTDPSIIYGPDWNGNHVVTGLENVPNVDTTNASNITSGTLAATRLPLVTIRKPASSATIAITTSDIEIGIDTRSTAVTVTLPSAVAWATANPFGLELVANDYFGNAATNNITPSLFAGDSFAYGGITPVITENFGLLRLRPDSSLPGWIVRGVN